MSRPITYPMKTMEIGDIGTMPVINKADAKRISRYVSKYGILNGRSYMCRTDLVKGLTFITRLG